MAVLFLVPRDNFVLATFLATGTMLAVSFGLGGLWRPGGLRLRSLIVGIVTAALLYLIFLAGAALIAAVHPFGITSASETSIYTLIASSSNPAYLQVGVLLLDAAGYESFFRGILQQKLEKMVGVGSAPLVALFDACLHLMTFNVLWVGATFVTDLVWGLAHHYGMGKQASFTSHFLWDVAIFIIRPVT
jgi:hypothetical protein